MTRRVLKIVFYSVLFTGLAYILYMPVFYNLSSMFGVTVDYTFYKVLIGMFTGRLVVQDRYYTGEIYQISPFSSPYAVPMLLMFVLSVIISVILIIGLIRKKLAIKRIGLILSAVLTVFLFAYFLVVTLNSLYTIEIVFSPLLIGTSSIPLLFFDKPVQPRSISDYNVGKRNESSNVYMRNDLDYNNDDDDLV